ncbi:hypothetical protein ACFE04_006422 [Oxalis oulophora]
MRREGLHSQLTSEPITNVISKPTDHSNFTGKCYKSNEKSLTSCRLISWRVVEDRPGLNCSDFSTTPILNILNNNCSKGVDNSNLLTSSEYHEEKNREIIGETNVDAQTMSFYDVGFTGDQIDGDDGWCFIGEIHIESGRQL